MKRKVYATMAGLLLAATGAMAQGPYATVSVGYGLPAGSDALGTKTTIQDNGDFTSENLYGTLGTGIFLNLSGGYMLSENIGADLGFNYLMGSTVTMNESDDATIMTTDKTEAYTRQMRLNPGLMVTTGNEEGLNVFARAGVVLPIGGATYGERTIDSPLGVTTVKTESMGAFSVGYSGSVGASFGLGEKLALFGQLQGVNLRIKQSTMTITENMTDGNDNLDGAPVSQYEIEYVDSLNQDDNTDPDQPAKALANTTNFSSLGVNVGVVIKF